MIANENIEDEEELSNRDGNEAFSRKLLDGSDMYLVIELEEEIDVAASPGEHSKHTCWSSLQ
jgi:hypothetical protein